MQDSIKNRTIFCRDNLEILQGINSNTIDLVYLDPPFNKKKRFTAPKGSSAEGASFRDIFTKEDIKQEWLHTIKREHDAIYRLLKAVEGIEGRPSYNFCYLAYMAIRLIECRRLLKDSGSIYLHCDPTMSHYLKLLLDCIFGEKNFRNEIVWAYTGPATPMQKVFSRKHDTIFWYSATDRWLFNKDDIRMEYTGGKPHTGGYGLDKAGAQEYATKGKIPEDWWIHRIAARSKREYVGYPAQKPLKLLDRIIKTSSNAKDIILDPFCGCATACVAAEKLDRQWIGIDISAKTYELVQQRIKNEVYQVGLTKGENAHLPDIHFRTDPPQRTDKEQ